MTPPIPETARTPWETGRALAHAFRSALGTEEGPIPTHLLCRVLDLDEAAFTAGTPVPGDAPGLGVRDPVDRRLLRLHFSKSRMSGRRFEAARFLADAWFGPRGDHWLPLTNARTARQRLQRAFAAEFLVPIRDIEHELARDYSVEACEALAERYSVSALTVQSQLANHGLIPANSVRA